MTICKFTVKTVIGRTAAKQARVKFPVNRKVKISGKPLQGTNKIMRKVKRGINPLSQQVT